MEEALASLCLQAISGRGMEKIMLQVEPRNKINVPPASSALKERHAAIYPPDIMVSLPIQAKSSAYSLALWANLIRVELRRQRALKFLTGISASTVPGYK